MNSVSEKKVNKNNPLINISHINIAVDRSESRAELIDDFKYT